jgi:molybdopterin converting factor small subunit
MFIGQGKLHLIGLVNHLLKLQYPNLTQLRNAFVLCKNQEYVEHNSAEELSDGDEVAIIPPISGG